MAAQYQSEIIDRICEQLVEGKTLEEICAQPGMPHRVTVWRWGKGDDEVAQRIRDCWEIGFIGEGDRMYGKVVTMAEKDPRAAAVMLDAAKWQLGRRSAAYADRPLVQGAIVNVGDGDKTFDAVARLLESASARISGSRESTYVVDEHGAARPVDAGDQLSDLAPDGRQRLWENKDRK